MRYFETMLVVGVTGGLACGKTEVCRVFQKKGATIVSGDQIGREVVEKNKKILKELVKVFGQEILNKNRTLNRRKLGEIAFASNKSCRMLNQIIHPFLLKKLVRQIGILRRNDTKGVVVVDAALIVEWGLDKKLDLLIVVDSKTRDQMRRFCSATGHSLITARNIIRCQLPKSTKKKRADLVISNSGNLKQLREKARKVWEKMVRESISEENRLTRDSN